MFFEEEPKPDFESSSSTALDGICMKVIRAQNYFSLTADTLAEYTSVLEDEYLTDYSNSQFFKLENEKKKCHSTQK